MEGNTNMRSGRGAVLSLVLAGAVVALAFSGCSSDDPAVSEGVADATAEAQVIVTEAGSDAAPLACVSCAVIIDATRRPSGAITTCDTNSVGPNGESSKQLLDIAFACVCTTACSAECSDTCGSGTALSPLCAACAGSKCYESFSQCQKDDPDLVVADSGTPNTDAAATTDAASDAGDDSGIQDAAVGQ